MLATSVELVQAETELSSLKTDVMMTAGWPPWAIKETAESICIPLSILDSRSLDTGVLPDGWKRGHVTPGYKKVAVVVQTTIVQLH